MAVSRAPPLTSCYSCDTPSHKSAVRDAGVRWPADLGLVLVDKLNAFYLNTATAGPGRASSPVRRAGLKARLNVALWVCAGRSGDRRGAGGKRHNSGSVPARHTGHQNSGDGGAQGCEPHNEQRVFQRGEGNRGEAARSARRGQGGLDPEQSSE